MLFFADLANKQAEGAKGVAFSAQYIMGSALMMTTQVLALVVTDAFQIVFKPAITAETAIAAALGVAFPAIYAQFRQHESEHLELQTIHAAAEYAEEAFRGEDDDRHAVLVKLTALVRTTNEISEDGLRLRLKKLRARDILPHPKKK
jgi:hypothetical protein